MGARQFGSTATIVDVILAILLPPLGVYLGYHFGVEFWICLVLTILGYIPGIIYALYVLLRPVAQKDIETPKRESSPSTFV